MKWNEVLIYTTVEAKDVVSVICTELGASGVAIEDSETLAGSMTGDGLSLDSDRKTAKEESSSEVIVKAYYPENIGFDVVDALKERLNEVSEFINTGDISIATNELDEQDWANNWKKYYKPFNITRDIVIKPTWEIYLPKKGEKIIEIDPGMAFGTGTHESTRLCAELISNYVSKGDKCADIGTGTGILAMLMILKDAGSVEAVDTDPTAVKVALENVQLNGLNSSISVRKGSVDTLPKSRYNIIAANIIADVIISMSERISHYIAKEGRFIASGIIRARAEEVKEWYINTGFTVEKVLEMGEWVGICFKWPGSL